MSKHVFRFFASHTSATGWTLDAEDAHHALKVLRLPAGETVEATDGKGALVRGSLYPTGKESANINDIIIIQDGSPSGTNSNSAHRVRLELAIGALKPGDLDEIIPAIVELGIDCISVFITEETGKNRLAEKAVDRWNRIIRTATKQSKRLWLPELLTFDSMFAWMAQLPKDPSTLKTEASSTRWIFAEPDFGSPGIQPGLLAAQSFARSFSPLSDGAPRGLIGVVGSERGFSTTEIEGAHQNGFTSVSLGPHVLRARTAAIAAATMLAMAGHASQ